MDLIYIYDYLVGNGLWITNWINMFYISLLESGICLLNYIHPFRHSPRKHLISTVIILCMLCFCYLWNGVQPSYCSDIFFFHPNSILHKNFFYGIIPTEIGDLLELKVLDLGYNNFNGPIPSELINILSLQFMCVRTLICSCSSISV